MRNAYVWLITSFLCIALSACHRHTSTTPVIVPENSDQLIEDPAGPPFDDATQGTLCGPNTANCPEGSFCMYPDEVQCDVNVKLGRCSVMPQICTREYNPVCGCDGKEYATRCVAYSQGVSVRNMGPCAATALNP